MYLFTPADDEILNIFLNLNFFKIHISFEPMKLDWKILTILMTICAENEQNFKDDLFLFMT